MSKFGSNTILTECPGCGAAVKYMEATRTLVGYGGYSAPHDHDDNCVLYRWICENGCTIIERLQNVCPVEGCDWKGKPDCFCSKLGIKAYPPPEKQ